MQPTTRATIIKPGLHFLGGVRQQLEYGKAYDFTHDQAIVAIECGLIARSTTMPMGAIVVAAQPADSQTTAARQNSLIFDEEEHDLFTHNRDANPVAAEGEAVAITAEAIRRAEPDAAGEDRLASVGRSGEQPDDGNPKSEPGRQRGRRPKL